jgi:hypothetical protein
VLPSTTIAIRDHIVFIVRPPTLSSRTAHIDNAIESTRRLSGELRTHPSFQGQIHGQVIAEPCPETGTDFGWGRRNARAEDHGSPVRQAGEWEAIPSQENAPPGVGANGAFSKPLGKLTVSVRTVLLDHLVVDTQD